jgi:ABC-type multidrug transport system ATPase subunit
VRPRRLARTGDGQAIPGYAAEEPSFHEELSALEYLAFVAAVRGLEPESAHARTLALAGPWS